MVMPSSVPSLPSTFQLGLVLAGAVSGGAYTAGVLDFLFEALDAFEAAKDDGEIHCPQHRVEIRVITGTSAGAMCAGLALPTLLDRTGTKPSPLHDAWVQRISIAELLRAKDLAEPTSRVVSLLDSTILTEIAESLLPERGASPSCFPAYVSDTLSVGVCTAGLRGVPYAMQFEGPGTTYGMRLHAMERWFKTGRAVSPASGWNPEQGGRAQWWTDLRQTCLASGAFPVGLAPRSLSFTRDEIDAREWPMTRVSGPTTGCVRPAWSDPPPSHFKSYHVDGGVFDNEPLELARSTLAGSRLGRNESDGLKATRAVLMVDPFLGAPADGEPTEEPGIFAALASGAAAIMQNARFKPEEIALALDETIFSRFLIAPPAPTPDVMALASGQLHAFGGFLSQSFREHDYALGRRNCQQFLRRWLVLPRANEIVRAWDAGTCQRHAIDDRKAPPASLSTDRAFRPLIPLRGCADDEQPLPRWPTWSDDDVQTLKAGLRRRSDAVVRALIREHVTNSALRVCARGAWGVFAGAFANDLFARIERALKVP